MIVRFREAIADRANDLNDAAVEPILNLAWQFVLPGEIDGNFREEDISCTLTTTNSSLSLDSSADPGGLGTNAGRIRQVLPGIRLGTSRTPLPFFDDSELFYNRYLWSHTDTGEPKAVLLQKRILNIYPTPDTFYELVIPASVYNPVLTSTGIANDDWAMATVRIAARDWTAEQGMDAASARMSTLAEDSKARMRSQSNARPNNNLGANRQWRDF
jgi:hypothetical protein